MKGTICDVDSWQGAVAEIEKIKRLNIRNYQMLYRGQSDAEWRLTTTLERQKGDEEVSFADYCAVAIDVKSEIEAVTGLSWASDYHKIADWIGNAECIAPPPMGAYLTYLRHHGFPSPLLDWSLSPYVAAYFAFAGKSGTDEGKVAIFVYLESVRGPKVNITDAPNIRVMDLNLTAHRRHFRQQSRYTICGVCRKESQGILGGEEKTSWYFASHDQVFNLKSAVDTDSTQDLLWKIMIPVSERQKVMRHLDEFNLNAYSLYGSEESLMDTLSFRVFETPRRRIPLSFIARSQEVQDDKSFLASSVSFRRSPS